MQKCENAQGHVLYESACLHDADWKTECSSDEVGTQKLQRQVIKITATGSQRYSSQYHFITRLRFGSATASDRAVLCLRVLSC